MFQEKQYEAVLLRNELIVEDKISNYYVVDL